MQFSDPSVDFRSLVPARPTPDTNPTAPGEPTGTSRGHGPPPDGPPAQRSRTASPPPHSGAQIPKSSSWHLENAPVGIARIPKIRGTAPSVFRTSRCSEQALWPQSPPLWVRQAVNRRSPSGDLSINGCPATPSGGSQLRPPRGHFSFLGHIHAKNYLFGLNGRK